MGATSWRFVRAIGRYGIYIVAALLFILVCHLWLKQPQNIAKLACLLNQPTRLDVRYVEGNLESLNQADPQLIEYVRARHLSPPSKLPYALTKGKGYYRDATLDWVYNFFRGKKNGVFIEVGAHDGVEQTHTLYLEREQDWSGLLIECNPSSFAKARSLHRNTWMAQACLSFSPNIGILNFTHPVSRDMFPGGTLNRRLENEARIGHKPPKEWISFDVETVPLITLLAAWGQTEVDYFSFDIEGGELAVLKTLPLDKFISKVMTIETYWYTEKEKKELDELMKSMGYYIVKSEGPYKDFIYVHNSVKHLI